MHIAVDCTSLVKINIVDRVPIIGPKFEITISLKITLVIKKFSVDSPATTIGIPTVTSKIVARPFLPLICF